jgi:hypothetical protein
MLTTGLVLLFFFHKRGWLGSKERSKLDKMP